MPFFRTILTGTVALAAVASPARSGDAPEDRSGPVVARGGGFTLESDMDGASATSTPVRGGRFTLVGRAWKDGSKKPWPPERSSRVPNPLFLLSGHDPLAEEAPAAHGFVLETPDGQTLAAPTD